MKKEKQISVIFRLKNLKIYILLAKLVYNKINCVSYILLANWSCDPISKNIQRAFHNFLFKRNQKKKIHVKNEKKNNLSVNVEWLYFFLFFSIEYRFMGNKTKKKTGFSVFVTLNLYVFVIVFIIKI